MPGTLFLVVGPSGVGKDTLIDGARERLAGDPAFVFPRRIVTRPAGAGGEDHVPATADQFAVMEREGAFFVTWAAHGLRYGLPASIRDDLAAGRNVVVNVSRRMIGEIVRLHDPVEVISVTADPETVRARLLARGREDAAAVAERIAREAPLPRAGVRIVEVANDGPVAHGIGFLVSVLHGAADRPLALRRAPLDLWREHLCVLHADSPAVAASNLAGAAMVEVRGGERAAYARLAIAQDAAVVGPFEAALSGAAFEALGLREGAPVRVRRSPSPASRDVVRKKVAGGTLTAGEIGRVVRDMVEGRYSQAELAGFLVAASTNLSLEEIVALTRVRAEYAHRFSWGRDLVVDKHSMGGVPGSRITLVVVPIVAASGLVIPKTSSRAITSAAGTADAMEALARVDLTPDELTGTVTATGGAIAWNGRINHSPVDDVMNAINRPLGIASASLDVSSILSKKLAMGSTDVVVDIPVGPFAKVRDRARGEGLARLFETVGQGVGLRVTARVTDGSRPIGRGVGPALEVRDALGVLSGAASAPADLREKALSFAAQILSRDPAVGPHGARGRAEEILASGAAAERLEMIVKAQGRREPAVRPGPFSRVVTAERGGRIEAVDCFRVAGIARAAGAPADKAAGIDLLKAAGETVVAGEPVMQVLAGSEANLELAGVEIEAGPVFRIA